MNLSGFLAQIDFAPPLAGPQKVFRSSAVAELALFALANRAQTPSPSQIAVLSDGLGIPSLLKPLLLKSQFRSKFLSGSFLKMITLRLVFSLPTCCLAGDEACFEQHVRNSSGHGLPRYRELSKSENFWPSAVPPRWGGTSGAARNMPRQDPLKS